MSLLSYIDIISSVDTCKLTWRPHAGNKWDSSCNESFMGLLEECQSWQHQRTKTTLQRDVVFPIRGMSVHLKRTHWVKHKHAYFRLKLHKRYLGKHWRKFGEVHRKRDPKPYGAVRSLQAQNKNTLSTSRCFHASKHHCCFFVSPNMAKKCTHCCQLYWDNKLSLSISFVKYFYVNWCSSSWCTAKKYQDTTIVQPHFFKMWNPKGAMGAVE